MEEEQKFNVSCNYDMRVNKDEEKEEKPKEEVKQEIPIEQKLENIFNTLFFINNMELANRIYCENLLSSRISMNQYSSDLTIAAAFMITNMMLSICLFAISLDIFGYTTMAFMFFSMFIFIKRFNQVKQEARILEQLMETEKEKMRNQGIEVTPEDTMHTLYIKLMNKTLSGK